MFNGIKKTRDKFNKVDWDVVSHFYDIHLDGTEQRHVENLNRTIWKVLDNSSEFLFFKQGYQEFVLLLDRFWDGLEEMFSLEPSP